MDLICLFSINVKWHVKSSLSLKPKKKRETSVKGSDSVQAELFGPVWSVKEIDGGSKTTVRTGKRKNSHL